ncbi:ankyrin repeat-containing domain protein [Aspergillus keveii]|uniref:Ankyrin repeat-containing domain protein n=1 Tax=Aspergillus keveii TaxID=714993 RepID=A0ABR4FMX6_9EURO
MSRYFSQLPEEITLEICKNLSTRSLAAFVKASSRTYRIGQPVLYSPQPDSRELLYVIKWSAKKNQERSMQYALPMILRSDEETRFRGLIHASKAGFTDIVRTLLDSGVCPDPPITGLQNSENPLEFEESSPLLAALRGGHYEIAEMLLESGTDLGLYGMEETAMLILAGDKRTGQILIDQGLEVQHVDASDHSTMLHKLCNIEHVPLDAIELLLDNGLDINQTNANRESPLDWAIRFGKPISTQQDIVRLLLSRGAQINEPCNPNGDLPVHVALDYAPMVELLIQMGSSVNAVNNRDMTPLGVLGFRDFTIYCNDQEYEVAKALLEAGALLSVNIPWAARLIKRAAISGHVDYIRLLLDAWEWQLSHRQPLSLTARFLAAAALGDIQTMEDVLNIKPEFLDTLLADYPSALEIAAKSRNQETIRFIVSKMHYYAGDHGLALCHVLAHGSEETICLLLSRISFVQKKDLISAVTKHSAVTLALLLGRLGELISERGQSSPQTALEFDDDEKITHKISRALKVAAATGKTEAACRLLQFMARHNLDCNQYHLPLVSAAKHGHDEIALIMIRQGHALNSPDEHGNTPLMIAASLGRVAIMKTLIEAGVDPTETNTRGRSPILMAAAGEHHDAVRYLMDTFPLSRLLPPGNPKTDIERMNLLAYAAKYNVADLGDYIMAHPDIHGNLVELFFWAAYDGKVHLVQVLLSHAPFRLLQHESKLRKQERLNQTALIYATSAPQ